LNLLTLKLDDVLFFMEMRFRYFVKDFKPYQQHPHARAKNNCVNHEP
jgi:hypothetical protein